MNITGFSETIIARPKKGVIPIVSRDVIECFIPDHKNVCCVSFYFSNNLFYSENYQAM